MVLTNRGRRQTALGLNRSLRTWPATALHREELDRVFALHRRNDDLCSHAIRCNHLAGDSFPDLHRPIILSASGTPVTAARVGLNFLAYPLHK